MLIKDSAPEVARVFAARWWAPILRGISVIAFGVLAFACPGVTVSALVLMLGFFYVHGRRLLFANRHREDRWLRALEGSVGVGALWHLQPWSSSSFRAMGSRLCLRHRLRYRGS